MLRKTGWGGFDVARLRTGDTKLKEDFYLSKMKHQATPLQGERVGAPSATETPALALRNEVARRQRVRARLAMLRKSK